MKRIGLYVSFIFILTSGGCSFFKHPAGGQAPADSLSPVVSHQFVRDGKVINKKRLEKGGNLLIVPFSPGEQVPASDDSDRLALVIVKGIAEVLKADAPRFNVLSAGNAGTAEFAVQGQLKRILEPAGIKKWGLRRKTKFFAVEGKIINSANGETLAYFSHSLTSKRRDQTFDDLAYEIGRDIGRFIASGAQGATP